MAKTLAKVLKTDISRLPLRKAAEELRKKGRGRDTMLAHITPREAAMLKARGGSGTINPDTGLPEFDDGFDFSGLFDATPMAQQGVDFSAPSYTPEAVTQAPTYQGPTQDYTFLSQPSQGFEQPFQAAQFEGGFQPSSGGEYFAGLLPNQYASANPDVQNAYRTAGQPLPADVAAKAYGDTSPVEFVQSGSPRDDALTLQMLGAQNAPSVAASVAPDVAALTGDSNKPGGLYQPPSFEEFQKGVAAAEGKAAPATGGIQTPFGNIATKDLIAALGVGGLGLTTLLGQSQAKKAATAEQAAYNQAAAQTRALAVPLGQQASQAYGLYQQGALTPANLQAEQIARAQIAQAAERSGGAVSGIQAGEAMARVRQNLLDSQLAAANSLFGQYNPLMAQGIKDELTGQITGIQTGLDMSAKLGSSAAQMAGLLAMMYAR